MLKHETQMSLHPNKRLKYVKKERFNDNMTRVKQSMISPYGQQYASKC